MKKLQLMVVLLLPAVLMAQQVQYTLSKVETGVNGTSWGSVIAQNGEMIFCSSDYDAGKNTKRTKLYSLKPGGSPQVLFEDESKELRHMGYPYITPDGRELYFAVSGKVKAKSKGLFKNNEEYYPLQIARSQRNSNGTWGPIVMFRYNMDDYSSGDPWLSNDGQYLYFASNRPGGLGGVDIWRSRRNNDGSWSSPENVREVNTKGDERSPRFDVNGNFYFSSQNGSFGGLDIFSSALLTNGHFTTPVRMAMPINSTEDDFAIDFIDEYKGYISSNRSGEDAIYKFEKISKEVIANMKIVGDGAPLSNVQLYFMSDQACDSKLLITDAEGQVSVKLEPEAPYSVLVYKQEYIPIEFKNELAKNFVNRTINLEEMPKYHAENVFTGKLEFESVAPKAINTGTTTNTVTGTTTNTITSKSFVLSNINFDYNKWDICINAARQLDDLAQYLKENGNMLLEIAAYTDCRGSVSFNVVLSQRRANAVKRYLVSRGIAPSRIMATGYGDMKPLNLCNCNRNIICSEAEHAENRRAEFRLVRE